MNIDPGGILSRVGLDNSQVFPITSDCPLCNGLNKLNIRHSLSVHCPRCGFSGDLIELYCQYHNKTLAQGCGDLIKAGVLDLGKAGIEGYTKRVGPQVWIKNFIHTRFKQTKEFVPATITAILESYNCRYSDAIYREFSKHAFGVHINDFTDFKFPESAKETLKWWKKYTSIGIPCYDAGYVTGLILVNSFGYRYLPLIDSAPGVAFGMVPKFYDKAVIVVDDPVTALRFNYACIMKGEEPCFIHPQGLQETLNLVSAVKTIYWSVYDSPQWYLRGLQNSDVLGFVGSHIKFDKSQGLPYNNIVRFINEVIEKACPIAQATAQILISCEDPKSALSGITLEPAQKVRCLGYVSGDDAAVLNEIFDTTISSQAITWNGNTIVETPQGWVCKGKIISSAPLYIDEVHPGDGDAEIIGHIQYNKQSFRFKEKLSIIRKNTAAFIERIVVSQSGQIPYIDKAWSYKLLEIAQQFHVPRAVMPDQRYGWNNGILRLPCFYVDSRGMFPSMTQLKGPRLLQPSPLGPVELDYLRRDGFAKLFLSLLGNLIRTRRGRLARSIILLNQKHVVERITSSLCLDKIKSTQDIKDSINNPLPSTGFDNAIWTTEGYVLTSSDEITALAARLNQDWSILDCGDQIDFYALRGIFEALVNLIDEDIDPDSTEFYRSIAKNIKLGLNPQTKTRLAMSAFELDSSNSAKTKAQKLLDFFIGLARFNRIKPILGDKEIILSHSEYLSSIATLPIPLPGVPRISEELAKAGYLVNPPKGVWEINPEAWGFHQSLNPL
jgi:hypothetical protein